MIKKVFNTIIIVLLFTMILSGCNQQESLSKSAEYNEILSADLVGFIIENNGEYYLNNHPFSEVNGENVTSYKLNFVDSVTNINPYKPMKVTGYYDETEMVIHQAVVSEPGMYDFEHDPYLYSYNLLVESGGLTQIQKYTNLAIATMLYPEDEEIKAEFDTIEDVDIDWNFISDIMPEDELLLSLSINCERLFYNKEVDLAESVINQLNELIQKIDTY